MSVITTEPMVTFALGPIVIPFDMVEFGPKYASSPIVTRPEISEHAVILTYFLIWQSCAT